MLSKHKIPIIFSFILILLSLLQLVFAFRTNAYFSIDDFRVLRYFSGHGVFQMISDFFLHGDIFNYRKIVGYIFFGVIFKNFGVNPNPYLFTMFVIHTINVLLLFFVVSRLTKNYTASLLSGIIFNKFYLFYFSNIHEITAAMLCLITIFIFLYYPKKVYLSLLTFVLALFSKELSYSLPFLLLSIALLTNTNIKKVIPYFVILFIYGLYQSYFLFVLKATSFINSYGVTVDLRNFGNMFLFYFSPYLIGLMILMPIITGKYKLLSILLVSLMTLFPVLFFGARREAYYFYIPAIYLLIYISMFLPKLSLKSAIVYVVIFFVFGGRSVLPKIAWQNFPNWQKVSIENVVTKVEDSLSAMPQEKSINLEGIGIERDAKLMLVEDDLKLFVGKNFSARYNFTYNQDANSIIATKNEI